MQDLPSAKGPRPAGAITPSEQLIKRIDEHLAGLPAAPLDKKTQNLAAVSQPGSSQPKPQPSGPGEAVAPTGIAPGAPQSSPSASPQTGLPKVDVVNPPSPPPGPKNAVPQVITDREALREEFMQVLQQALLREGLLGEEGDAGPGDNPQVTEFAQKIQQHFDQCLTEAFAPGKTPRGLLPEQREKILKHINFEVALFNPSSLTTPGATAATATTTPKSSASTYSLIGSSLQVTTPPTHRLGEIEDDMDLEGTPGETDEEDQSLIQEREPAKKVRGLTARESNKDFLKAEFLDALNNAMQTEKSKGLAGENIDAVRKAGEEYIQQKLDEIFPKEGDVRLPFSKELNELKKEITAYISECAEKEKHTSPTPAYSKS